MTQDKKERRAGSTVTLSESAARADLKMDVLTTEEEHVLRMRHGLGEGDEYELKFGLGANEEALLKLANLERFLLEKFATTASLNGAFDAVDAPAQSTSSNSSGEHSK